MKIISLIFQSRLYLKYTFIAHAQNIDHVYKPLLYSELWENNDYFLQDHNRIIECVLDALMYVFMWHEHYNL